MKYMDDMARRPGNEAQSPWLLPPEVCGKTSRRCDVIKEAFCAGLQCQLNDTDLVGRWFPVNKALKPPTVSQEVLARQQEALTSHESCPARCASQSYLTIDVAGGVTRTTVAGAAARLAECGLVHLSGGAWSESGIRQWADAVSALRQLPAADQEGLKRADLRANRTEFFLPFAAELPEPL